MELISQFLALEPTSQVLGKEPIVPFAILLLVILIVPILFERLRLPGIFGLLASGIVLGPHGWNLLQTASPLMTLLSDIGLVYLIFVAGLEVDLVQFRRNKNRSLAFGSFTFLVPLFVGATVVRIFGFNWNAAILVGSLFASYTLLAYPILTRLAVVSNEAVNMTIGASILTDASVLLILTVCVAIHTNKLGVWQVVTLLNSLIIYALFILIGFDWLGKQFFRRSGDDQGNQFLFVLLSVFLASVGAQFIGVQKIVGAFLAGLAVNEVLGDGPVKEKILFVGNVLFIPIFFVNVGLLVNLPIFLKSFGTLNLTLLILIGLVTSKFIAAFLTKLFYRYNWQETLTIWSLSIPQAGVTLAATLVGYRAGILNLSVLDSAIFLIVVTSALGPLITGKVAVGLSSTPQKVQKPTTSLHHQNQEKRNSPFTIVVPVYNPQTQQYLIEMAALLARQGNGKIIPLAVATAFAHMDAPQLDASVQRSERLLAKATALSQVLGVEAQPLLRIDDAFAPAISRASREQRANLIVMGWGNRTGLKARLFGNVIDSVLWGSHCPVAVMRLVESPKKIQRILVPVENLLAPSLQPVQFAQIVADANQAQVTLLNVCERRTSPAKIAHKQSQLSLLVSKLGSPNPPEVQIITHENIAQAILQAARLYDLVVLPFTRNRTSPGGLAISDVTNQLVRQLTCSIIMLGEPHRTHTVLLPSGVTSTATMSQGII
ncbi:cation:proton antiporter [Aetokthonos hydrillicola Thurmond2011]|jgi:Kef-type K+ transport system membrane component KefB/nucleotide-binding universal stress UspA family protein|uniref:Cation:proton antiporter n=2 Tax=Aetokthonos TaxID=1550243 RepID=A0AAP5IAF9_9CYAN|nr:cation:proton antiporter [Aetokthonos hydrillicola]MBO3458854.1 universal stress protein [Aetokthonos hydrillicola CCALA 1050]MBW4587298.1 cation:proton antiporter [Aetokthonos hydrillicola CCALA 1050]MDR9896679.1 cation:proton antiporter [Aetokthonos hydrillicola Thurmond2011]